ncbi:unnamed protein product [Cladocopium goreaui]|uniref:60S ribosomal protein L18a-3 n=1 Tax=Cladocopium goreaui TaxID=2562237 RepID=A0A9P1FZM7_9DINO|nr:unnamed protein product [Cladocopium goreaui]
MCRQGSGWVAPPPEALHMKMAEQQYPEQCEMSVTLLLQAIPKQLEQSNIEAKSLQDLRSRLDRLEGSVSMQSSKAQKEEEVRKKLVERLENLEVSSTRAMLQPRLDGFEAATLRMSKEVHSLQSRLERLDQDFARHFARLEDLEQERREGQMLEEVLQDKVGRIERLEAAVKGDARSISSVRDEIARLGSTEDGKQERLRHLETQLAALERWRKDDAQVRLTRCDQQIQTFTQLAEESAQSPLISEVTGRVEQLHELILQTQAAKVDSEELKELKVELGRVSALAERSAEKSEVTEVSRCLQNSIASAQESMSSIKEELLQALFLAPEYRLRCFPAPVQNNQGLALFSVLQVRKDGDGAMSQPYKLTGCHKQGIDIEHVHREKKEKTPIVTGYSYCRQCVLDWFRSHERSNSDITSPITGEPLSVLLLPNLNLREVIVSVQHAIPAWDEAERERVSLRQKIQRLLGNLARRETN